MKNNMKPIFLIRLNLGKCNEILFSSIKNNVTPKSQVGLTGEKIVFSLPQTQC
jgi:hypothetical protein